MNDKFLLPVQKFVALNQKSIKWFFRLLYLVVIVAYVMGIMALKNDPDNWLPMFMTGTKIGQMALVTYIVTLVPGMLKRFNILPTTKAILHLFRRQFGVLMFLLAFLHGGYTTSIAFAVYPPVETPILPTHVILGFVTLWILFPLWLTSNDPAHKKMGKWWKRLHRLTYVAMWTVFGHLAFMGSTWRYLILVVILLEIASAAVYWYTKRNNE